MKHTIIFGTSDEHLRQEALPKAINYPTLMKAVLGYEQSRKASRTTCIKASTTLDTTSNMTYTEDQIEGTISRVIAGQYSMRKPDKTKSDTS